MPPQTSLVAGAQTDFVPGRGKP